LAFDYELVQAVRYGTHYVLMGRVTDLRLCAGQPHLYADWRYRHVA
jgi:flavin reductase (DIM6/NTAB) family NADH-FMN oxidoreductase RutF